jgi:hypothetical protein
MRIAMTLPSDGFRLPEAHRKEHAKILKDNEDEMKRLAEMFCNDIQVKSTIKAAMDYEHLDMQIDVELIQKSARELLGMEPPEHEHGFKSRVKAYLDNQK